MSNYVADPVLDATADYLTDTASAIAGLTADIEHGNVIVTQRNVASIRAALATMTSQTIDLVAKIESGLALKSGMN
jgi:hypothetical protein